ncbi:SAM-dependent methyltransferase [Mycolicibacterium moriokaense]|uniref:Methyltransferase n=1 Tax=Mycolicibacterium moriokaense TaxID=39691 RepID=A0AAD1M8F8_9MYCO|nr:class I SAM-dependent methyltransferase [Mycolicibacterium moriokaense]MCV7038889.1 methyltransferase domain-containing protein [Mycolicibacterium moriokaense]ORB25479.1 SAM-dependent methyltransferase [Mycolicibacterium moriokaense]BBX03499.1 methyltransferase [Mycolicibacterium moriokaense]
MTGREALPLAERSDADLPGHWLLARLGKRVLRPGGLELTSRMLAAAGVSGSDVVELGPGLGRTARDIVALRPRSYVGVDDTAAATDAVRQVVAPVQGKVVVADAAVTGLPDDSADVVIGEAMLTMQGDKAKRAIIAEAFRVLRPGGRYAIHELGLKPDSIPQETKDDIRRDLARSIKVNARPLTTAEWVQLLSDAGFVDIRVDYAPMALLNPARVLADEGPLGALRIVGNLIVRGAARARVIGMRRTFHKYRRSLTAVSAVGVVPAA